MPLPAEVWARPEPGSCDAAGALQRDRACFLGGGGEPAAGAAAGAELCEEALAHYLAKTAGLLSGGGAVEPHTPPRHDAAASSLAAHSAECVPAGCAAPLGAEGANPPYGISPAPKVRADAASLVQHSLGVLACLRALAVRWHALTECMGTCTLCPGLAAPDRWLLCGSVLSIQGL